MNYSNEVYTEKKEERYPLNYNFEAKEIFSPKFNIEKVDNISLKDLQRLKEEGFSVIRSSHLWNQYPSNLFLLAWTIPNLLYDKNQNATSNWGDKNYNPESLIKNWEKQKIIEEDEKNRIVPKQKISLDKLSDEVKKSIWDVFWLWEFHYKFLKSVFPDTEVKIFSERFLENSKVTRDFLNILIQNYLVTWDENIVKNTFDRYITKDWDVLNFSNIQDNKVIYTSKDNIKEINLNEIVVAFFKFTEKINKLTQWVASLQDFDNINNKTEWPILSNVMNVFFSGVLEALNTGKNELYHCSGPDMIEYINNISDILNHIYEIVYNNTSLDLPEEIKFNIIPTATMKFYEVEEGVWNKLISLLDSEKQKQGLNKSKWEKIKSAKKEWKDISSIIQTFQSKIDLLKEEDKKEFNAISEVFKNSNLVGYLNDIRKSSNYLTQYDLIWKTNKEIDHLLMQYSLWNVKFKDIKSKLDYLKKKYL